jgi:hypothetical protein
VSCLVGPVGFSALICYCFCDCDCDWNMHVREGLPEEAMSDADDLARNGLLRSTVSKKGLMWAKIGRAIGNRQRATGNRRGYDDTTPARTVYPTRIPRR